MGSESLTRGQHQPAWFHRHRCRPGNQQLELIDTLVVEQRPVLLIENKRLQGIRREKRAEGLPQHLEDGRERVERHRTLVAFEQRNESLGHPRSDCKLFLSELVRHSNFADPLPYVHFALPMERRSMFTNETLKSYLTDAQPALRTQVKRRV